MHPEVANATWPCFPLHGLLRRYGRLGGTVRLLIDRRVQLVGVPVQSVPVTVRTGTRSTYRTDRNLTP